MKRTKKEKDRRTRKKNRSRILCRVSHILNMKPLRSLLCLILKNPIKFQAKLTFFQQFVEFEVNSIRIIISSLVVQVILFQVFHLLCSITRHVSRIIYNYIYIYVQSMTMNTYAIIIIIIVTIVLFLNIFHYYISSQHFSQRYIISFNIFYMHME